MFPKIFTCEGDFKSFDVNYFYFNLQDNLDGEEMVDEYSDITLLKSIPFSIARPVLKAFRQKTNHFLVSNMKFCSAYEYFLLSSD